MEPTQAIRQAVEAAIWAPSVHNTQPWTFGLRGSVLSLRADADRRLAVADPDGRESLISCGAALFTLRIALRALGFEAQVRVLPDPDRPNLLAEVSPGGRVPEDEHAQRLYEAVQERRTHRGAFKPVEVESSLLPVLRLEAELEGVRLIQAVDANTQGALAGLTQAAEHVQRLSPSRAAEAARWAPAPGSTRADGVPATAYPDVDTPHTEPYFPGRDFARGHGWGVGQDDPAEPSIGQVMLLATLEDTPREWIHAGQALQRMLLRAAADQDLAAAFHTQALEVPELREFVRTRFTNDLYPQVLLRLGVPVGPELVTVRREVDEVLVQE